MAAPRLHDRAKLVPIICAELAKGGKPLTCILADLDPPLPPTTLKDWRKDDSDIGNAIDEAFELGIDRMAMGIRQMARGSGESTGSVKRDRLALHYDDKLISMWDTRYRRTVAHANDPKNPLTDTAARLSDEDLLRIAQKSSNAKDDAPKA